MGDVEFVTLEFWEDESPVARLLDAFHAGEPFDLKSAGGLADVVEMTERPGERRRKQLLTFRLRRRDYVPPAVTRFVLLFGECDPELLGVYDAAEDARLAAERRAGHGLAWAHWPWGLQSADYRVVEVPYHEHAAFREGWNAETIRQLTEASDGDA